MASLLLIVLLLSKYDIMDHNIGVEKVADTIHNNIKEQ